MTARAHESLRSNKSDSHALSSSFDRGFTSLNFISSNESRSFFHETSVEPLYSVEQCFAIFAKCPKCISAFTSPVAPYPRGQQITCCVWTRRRYILDVTSDGQRSSLWPWKSVMVQMLRIDLLFMMFSCFFRWYFMYSALNKWLKVAKEGSVLNKWMNRWMNEASTNDWINRRIN